MRLESSKSQAAPAGAAAGRADAPAEESSLPVDLQSETDFDVRFGGFQNLMPHRVQQILLVSSMYESFILEEDGMLSELITTEYMDMNLSQPPRVKGVCNREEALQSLQSQPVDLLITMTRLGSLKVADFAGEARRLRPDLPIVILADSPRELVRQPGLRSGPDVDRVFVWNGNARLILAIIKFVEDQLNVEHDTRIGNVRVIILIENSIRFYSTYLPLIYTQLLKLTQSLMEEGLNVKQRLLRMRARPKILLAETFEEAWALYSKFGDHLLGIISDVRFPRKGQLDPEAGLEFTRLVKADNPDLPVLLQSSEQSHAWQANRLQAGFLNKRSRNLLHDLRGFIRGSLGFGDFVFIMPDHTEVGRASDLRSFEEVVGRIPDESLKYHASNNHFSNWLMARTEFELAELIRPKKVSDFKDLNELRRYLLDVLAEFRERAQTGIITDFSAKRFDVATTFTRMGGGSMGGKARGLAFINALIREHGLAERFPDVRIAVPNVATIGTDAFDAFMEKNRLYLLATRDVPDSEVVEAFLAARLPRTLHKKLAYFAGLVHYPLAVRSSSLLEDSPDQPFAGIYQTYMLPNNHEDEKVRLMQLCTAVKLVYASTFSRAAKRYMEATAHHAEEEKMAVVLQEIVGSVYGKRFYPTFAGVARSYNFYPTAHMAPEEGVASVALGLGTFVVEGGQAMIFSPVHPRSLPQFPDNKTMLANSQRHFFALDLSNPNFTPDVDSQANLIKLGLEAAEKDGTLAPIGSVYSPDNDRVYDGVSRPGTRLVTFAHVLNSNLIPLADILQGLLEIGQKAMGGPIEIEFAVDMKTKPAQFGFLQIRPIPVHEQVVVGEIEPKGAVCFSPQAMGNGRLTHIQDIVYVKPSAFDSAKTREIATEIGQINERLRKAGKSCVLIGPGRWGSADRWLGIPVSWEQISCAGIIVETTLRDFVVAPSQGTHFFQNLTALRVGYFTVQPPAGVGFIDWDWLAQQQVVNETQYLRHIAVAQPLEVKIDGRTQRGVILKPNGRGSE